MSTLLLHMQSRQAIRSLVKHSSSPLPATKLSRFNVDTVRGASFARSKLSSSTTTNQLHQALSGYHFQNNGMAMAPIAEMHTQMVQKINFGARINRFVKKHSLAVSVVITAAKATLADIVAQKVFEKKENLDKKRTFLFFAFGGLYSGVICHFIYTKIYPFLFPIRSVKSTLGMISCDNLINTPLIFFPLFYSMKAMVEEMPKKVEYIKHKFATEWGQSVRDAWKIWIPAQFITFGVMPVHMRVPFTTVISFFFFSFVSFQENRSRREIEEEHAKLIGAVEAVE